MSNSTLHFAVSQSSAPSSSPMSKVKHYLFGMHFAERVSGLQIISVCAKSAQETSQSMRMREGGRERERTNSDHSDTDPAPGLDDSFPWSQLRPCRMPTQARPPCLRVHHHAVPRHLASKDRRRLQTPEFRLQSCHASLSPLPHTPQSVPVFRLRSSR